jgi:hypothetical protein
MVIIKVIIFTFIMHHQAIKQIIIKLAFIKLNFIN